LGAQGVGLVREKKLFGRMSEISKSEIFRRVCWRPFATSRVVSFHPSTYVPYYTMSLPRRQ